MYMYKKGIHETTRGSKIKNLKTFVIINKTLVNSPRVKQHLPVCGAVSIQEETMMIPTLEHDEGEMILLAFST